MTTQDIIKFLQDEHTRVALAFIVAFIGYCYPQAQTICNFLAGYLGTTVAVTVAQKALTK